ncbi:hypothetical protein STRAU_0801 [Streptomyces aurantiacus JA 4570]|uniref:Peptidase S53 domain-containing protein n=1 Tax=Streptomyces aurantiacus JA 4570 TaxID=1286094 RepID=S4A5Q7_9ACTN|nr:hypothetical protein STRAU_0801 [Streptomyces aurantiacus JA 4570]
MIAVLGCVPALGACVGSDAVTSAADSTAAARPASSVSPGPPAVEPFPSVPAVEDCREALKVDCYTPDMVRRAYGVDRLNAQGLTGKGRTVAVFAGYAPPTLEKDLREFSRAMELPEPHLTVRKINSGVTPAPFDPSNPAMITASMETTLDVQMVHTMAPDAKIVVAEYAQAAFPRRFSSSSASPEDGKKSGEQDAEAYPELLAAIVRQDDPDVISLSVGDNEYRAAGDTGAPVAAYRRASRSFAEVLRGGTTLVSAAGDAGAAPPIGPDNTRVRSVSWPASDPSFLSLGGSRLHLDARGRRTGPDTVWNDSAQGRGATGGGPSQTFTRPAYQDGVRGVVGERRGTPDISMDAATSGGTLIYQSLLPAGPGWVPIGGTSEAAPLFAAVVALADEKAGRRLGDIHDELYRLAKDPRGGIVDITEGDNGPDGFAAAKGYDLASGLGTIDAATFVPALARLADG